MAIKWLLITYCCLIDQCLAQPPSEKLLLAVDGNEKRFTKKVRDLGALSLTWYIFIKSLPSRLRDQCRRSAEWKKSNSQSWRTTPRKQYLLDRTRMVHVRTLTTCTRPEQVQARQKLRTKRSSSEQKKVPTLTKKASNF